MALPFLQSYNDPKKQKAYLRYMEGKSQRQICAALKLSRRTFNSWSKKDEWEEERKARKIAASSEAIVSATAQPDAPPAPPLAPGGAIDSNPARPETRLQGMERMLARQQRLTGKLLDAYERDVDKTLADAETTGKTLSRSQVAQLTTLGNNLMAMERKAWCVPDKIETRDTTPQKADPIREMTDDQLERELAAERDRDAAAAERARAAAAAREAPKESVN